MMQRRLERLDSFASQYQLAYCLYLVIYNSAVPSHLANTLHNPLILNIYFKMLKENVAVCHNIVTAHLTYPTEAYLISF